MVSEPQLIVGPTSQSAIMRYFLREIFGIGFLRPPHTMGEEYPPQTTPTPATVN